MNPIAIRLFAYGLLASLLVFGGCRWQARLDAGELNEMALKAAEDQAALAAAQVEASEWARKQEQDKAQVANEVAAAYERGKDDAKAAGDRVAADLRAGVSRLQDRWRGCEARRVPGAADTPGEPDASAADRNDSAGRIIGAGAACDAQVIGLQQFILSERP